MAIGWTAKTYTARADFACLCGRLVLAGDRLGYVRVEDAQRDRAVHYSCALTLALGQLSQPFSQDLTRFTDLHVKLGVTTAVFSVVGKSGLLPHVGQQ
jgi:hypothetical protein